MKSMLSQLLFQTAMPPQTRGRMVRFDVNEVDIRISTGPMEDRILHLLKLHGYPLTRTEIAMAIESNASQVSRGIKLLLARDQIDVAASEGRVKEYVLKS